MNKEKTISKHFYDDEIREVLDNGDIYLKTGVRRQPKYRFSTEEDEFEASYWNEQVYKRDYIERIQRIRDEENNWD